MFSISYDFSSKLLLDSGILPVDGIAKIDWFGLGNLNYRLKKNMLHFHRQVCLAVGLPKNYCCQTQKDASFFAKIEWSLRIQEYCHQTKNLLIAF